MVNRLQVRVFRKSRYGLCDILSPKIKIIKREIIKFGGEYFDYISADHSTLFFVIMPFDRYLYLFLLN